MQKLIEDKKVYLIGYTGVVGSNLSSQYGGFDKVANSKNVQEMYNERPDILIYAGIPGTKWVANQYEEQDKSSIEDAMENITLISPKKLVLISTVDVYDDLNGTNEKHINNLRLLHTYGRHRLQLENWVKDNIEDYHIVRLPALYGQNLKKNFIFDMVYFIPNVLNEEKMELVRHEYRKKFGDENDIKEIYYARKNGEYCLKNLTAREIFLYRSKFEQMKNNALLFTNSSSEFQFYNLVWLWEHICKVIDVGIREIALVTEPLAASEVYQYVYGKVFFNNNIKEIKYNLFTQYAEYITGNHNYLFNKEFILKDLKAYVERMNTNLF